MVAQTEHPLQCNFKTLWREDVLSWVCLPIKANTSFISQDGIPCAVNRANTTEALKYVKVMVDTCEVARGCRLERPTKNAPIIHILALKAFQAWQ